MKLGGWEGVEDLGRVGRRGEAMGKVGEGAKMIKIYCMEKIKRKKKAQVLKIKP